MKRNISKIILIVFTISLFILSVNVNATNDLVSASDMARQSLSNLENEEETADLEEDDENTIESSSGSNKPTNQVSYTSNSYVSPTSQPTTSYSTVATIPEANLSLNNILNVILIAVGVILILLAIAIIIRLK